MGPTGQVEWADVRSVGSRPMACLPLPVAKQSARGVPRRSKSRSPMLSASAMTMERSVVLSRSAGGDGVPQSTPPSLFGMKGPQFMEVRIFERGPSVFCRSRVTTTARSPSCRILERGDGGNVKIFGQNGPSHLRRLEIPSSCHARVSMRC